MSYLSDCLYTWIMQFKFGQHLKIFIKDVLYHILFIAIDQVISFSKDKFLLNWFNPHRDIWIHFDPKTYS